MSISHTVFKTKYIYVFLAAFLALASIMILTACGEKTVSGSAQQVVEAVQSLPVDQDVNVEVTDYVKEVRDGSVSVGTTVKSYTGNGVYTVDCDLRPGTSTSGVDYGDRVTIRGKLDRLIMTDSSIDLWDCTISIGK